MAMAEPERAVTIRLATSVDVEALARIGRLAYRVTYPGIVPNAVLDEWAEHTADSWEKAFAEQGPDSPWRPWAAERDGRIIGYATTSPGKDWWLPPPAGAGELTNLYLDPEAIGTGAGSALFDTAVADLRGRGFNPFVVWAFRANQRAVRFYERKGLAIDVPDHDWVLGDVRCPIVRLRVDWPATDLE